MLEHNKNIKVFDISFNSIGGGVTINQAQLKYNKKSKFAFGWSQCFKNNDTLIHVDISNNNLSWPEMEIIGEGLRKNHTILGLHVKGNMAQVDSQGFITQRLDSISLANLHMNTRLNDKVDTKKKPQSDLTIIENCWICEGWSCVKFNYTPGVSDSNKGH